MATLAGVVVGEVGYPAEGLQQLPGEYAPAGVAAGRVVAEGAELVHLTERASEGVGSGSEGASCVAFTCYKPGLTTS